MTTHDDRKAEALASLAASRELRATADERWERRIALTVASGASLRETAEVAGVSHSTVRRIVETRNLPSINA